ncbi:MAG: hypothetical protein ABI895_19145 [Deltaproteobacteria bacterium]
MAALIAGCVYDSDDRCSPDQTLLSEAFCLCPEDSVLIANDCVPCGENEVAGSGGCVCAAGFSRPAEGAACEVLPSTLGVACDTASTPCADATDRLCHAASGTAGYCTRACTSSADCEGGYACDTAATPAYCRRPPVRAGKACMTAADCAGTEAPVCESFMAHACVVVCAPATPDCFPGTKCCDFTMRGAPAPFCLPEGAC